VCVQYNTAHHTAVEVAAAEGSPVTGSRAPPGGYGEAAAAGRLRWTKMNK